MSSAETSEGAREGDEGARGSAREPLAPASEDYAQLRLDFERAVRRICPAWLASHSDDIVQRALIRVSGILERSETPPALAASYLRKAAYSALIDEIRAQRRRQEVPLEEEEGPQVTQTTDPSPERMAASGEIGRAILDCLGRLKKERRLAVTLRLQGHTVPEAARILGWSDKVTENLVYRGQSDLRICLTAKGITP